MIFLHSDLGSDASKHRDTVPRAGSSWLDAYQACQGADGPGDRRDPLVLGLGDPGRPDPTDDRLPLGHAQRQAETLLAFIGTDLGYLGERTRRERSTEPPPSPGERTSQGA